MRGLGIILSGTLGASVALAGSAGYLPKVGPATMRFQAPRSLARLELPPLQMQDVLPPIAQMLDVAASHPHESAADSLPPETVDLTAIPTNLLNQIPTIPPTLSPDSNRETNAVITPQMLLRFFTPPGTGRETVIVTPPGFSPARPGQPASSSATYSSPKP